MWIMTIVVAVFGICVKMRFKAYLFLQMPKK